MTRHDSSEYFQNNQSFPNCDDHPRFVQSWSDAVTDVLPMYHCPSRFLKFVDDRDENYDSLANL